MLVHSIHRDEFNMAAEAKCNSFVNFVIADDRMYKQEIAVDKAIKKRFVMIR